MRGLGDEKFTPSIRTGGFPCKMENGVEGEIPFGSSLIF